MKLTNDRFAAEGAREGMLGYVIEAWPDGTYDVEFSDPRDGRTIAQIVANESDVVVVPDEP